MTTPEPSALDTAIKIVTLLGGICAFFMFLAGILAFVLFLGTLKKTLMDLVARMDRVETKVDTLQTAQDQALGREQGREQAMSHVVPIHVQTLSGIGGGR